MIDLDACYLVQHQLPALLFIIFWKRFLDDYRISFLLHCIGMECLKSKIQAMQPI